MRVCKTVFLLLVISLVGFFPTCKPPVVNVEAVSVTSDLTLKVGESGKIEVTISPDNATNKAVVFSSSDLDVASVGEDGTVTALKAGTAVITVTSVDGNISANCSVTITDLSTPPNSPTDPQNEETSEFVNISIGSYSIGSTRVPDEGPVHNVTITRSFSICKHEVTQKEFLEVMGVNPSGHSENPISSDIQEERPVDNVNWAMAIVYCNKRSIAEKLEPCYTVAGVDFNTIEFDQIPLDEIEVGDVFLDEYPAWNAAQCDFTKNGYRLPTEAEWEIAARAGDDRDVWAGTDDDLLLGNYAWFSENSDLATHQVMTRDPNGNGLFDMCGNVWEWCWDYNLWNYYSTPEAATDPVGPEGSDEIVFRVFRGGAYSVEAINSRISYRGSCWPYERYPNVGFRVVRTITE